MALDTSSGYVAPSGLADASDASPSIFNLERVELKFDVVGDFVAAQVANNVIILALASGRILRIDLRNAADIDGGLFSSFCPCWPF
jgi:hypothetical protein